MMHQDVTMTVNPLELLGRYFSGDALELVVTHAGMVAALAVGVGRNLALPADELRFLHEAAMLHDIGVCRVHAPGIGMHGTAPYIQHGVLGRAILEAEGLPRHALVCERHIGVGLTVADIVAQRLPLPQRDMLPQTLAEEIICFADLFFSKTPGRLTDRKSPEKVRENLARFGAEKVLVFDSWLARFGMALQGQ